MGFARLTAEQRAWQNHHKEQRRRHESSLRCLLEEGSGEAALSLPDETPSEWTDEGLLAFSRVLGHGKPVEDPWECVAYALGGQRWNACDGDVRKFKEGLPRAANAIAKRWCRSSPRCETNTASSHIGSVAVSMVFEGCPVGECLGRRSG